MLDPWQCDILTQGLGERADGTWSAFEVAQIVPRQNGKGSVFEARELAGLVLFGEELIIHTAHELKTALEAFRRVQALFANSDELGRLVRRVTSRNGEEGIELRSGARLRFVARSTGSGRGFSGDCVILDEAYALTADQMAALLPTLSARPNPQIWYGSSPPLNAVSGAQLFSVRRRGIAGQGRLAYFDWGIPGQLDDLGQIDLDDRALWAAANPAYGLRISEEFIAGERDAMDDIGFARERLGIWPPDLGSDFQIISQDAWGDRLDERSKIAGSPAFVVDVSPDRSRAAIGVAGARGDGDRHVELVDHQPGTGWVIPRLLELRGRWRPCSIGIDPVSPAGSLIADAEAAGLEIYKLSTRDVTQAFGSFIDGIAGEDEASRVVWHIGQPELTSALAGAARRRVGEAWAWDRRNAAVDITPLVAVTNALHLFALFGQGADRKSVV